MKKLKYLIIVIILFAVGLIFFNKDGNNIVKVYIFEAGGCPACEKELAYLKSLESYERDFTIVRKELYIDHEDFEEGKDYELGKRVAEEFIERGFEDASYEGTPLVIISNLYAATGYSTDLEVYINEASKEGDVDAVGCIEKDGINCLDVKPKKDNSSQTIKIFFLLVFAAGLLSYIISSSKNNRDKNSIEDEREYETKNENEENKINNSEKKVVNSKTKKTKKGNKK